MIRASQKLAALRDAMLNHALIGGSISAFITADICELLDQVAAECEEMEKRLTGDLSVNVGAEGGNIISFIARALARRNHQPGGSQ
ncbi:hypothetical protein [Rhizobium lusitanum]|uniref:Uncharacterized protein n=1 Tax=Rhizobium lusitanum TaxID=293958 RepID=A0A1C3US29_9HYPH|nr:hypothetical protein [Rhizobium lusitanum]SCB18310.1 hypothetical protein GA0061101_103246 [Rhizobium lusitanum]